MSGVRATLGLYKICQFMLYVCTAVHLAGCIWYFNARLQNFSPNSWVVRRDLVDADMETLYFTSVYWAFSAVTTVGFGDISATLKSEMLISVLWMTIGVVFYSFAIGSLSTFLSVVNTREEMLNTKLSAIKHFAEETGISRQCTQKITAAVKYRTQKSISLFKDRLLIFNELPRRLKAKVAFTMHRNIARTCIFMKGKDLSFITSVMPCLHPLKVYEGNFLYEEGEHADEMYIIVSGQIDLIIKRFRFAYKTFVKGSTVGDIELVLRTNRSDCARAAEICELLVMSKLDFFKVFKEFTDLAAEYRMMAYKKARRNARVKAKAIAAFEARELGINLKDTEEMSLLFEESLSKIKIEETELEKEAKAAGQVRDLRNSVEELSVKLRNMEEKVKGIFSWLDTI